MYFDSIHSTNSLDLFIGIGGWYLSYTEFDFAGVSFSQEIRYWYEESTIESLDVGYARQFCRNNRCLLSQIATGNNDRNIIGS
jgi:hypothetical protein